MRVIVPAGGFAGAGIAEAILPSPPPHALPLLCNFTHWSRACLFSSYVQDYGLTFAIPGMETTTRQGKPLVVTLEALQRVKGGHPEPILSFRYPGGILCSSYYLSTFQSIPAGEGLCLEGQGTYCLELSPDSVAMLQFALSEGLL